MILPETKLVVADNTGVKEVKCINVLGKKRRAEIGDIVVASVKKRIPTSDFVKGDVVRGVVVRTRKAFRRADGSTLRFDDNAVVLVDKNMQPIGTRVFGPVARELRDRGMMRIISLAPEVV
ncbi:MAG: 50S ribosomal protein L14 [Candidatus Acetothermia bacterium]|jgi:large subunit ribosomal protein L14|nr:50S ribosomal protein L14 [Candidatus Acetothermia bacterium]